MSVSARTDPNLQNLTHTTCGNDSAEYSIPEHRRHSAQSFCWDGQPILPDVNTQMPPTDPRRHEPFALSLTYQRDLSADALVTRSLRGVAERTSLSSKKQLASLLRSCFANVAAGDRFTGVSSFRTGPASISMAGKPAKSHGQIFAALFSAFGLTQRTVIDVSARTSSAPVHRKRSFDQPNENHTLATVLRPRAPSLRVRHRAISARRCIADPVLRLKQTWPTRPERGELRAIAGDKRSFGAHCQSNGNPGRVGFPNGQSVQVF
jgi:hypothetical protein